MLSIFVVDFISIYNLGKHLVGAMLDVNIVPILLSTNLIYLKGPSGSMSLVVGLPNNSYKLITNTVVSSHPAL